MTQLALPLRKSAGPLSPLSIAGARQAARMLVLADMADCRLDLGLEADWYRSTFKTEVVEINHARHRREILDDHRRLAALL